MCGMPVRSSTRYLTSQTSIAHHEAIQHYGAAPRAEELGRGMVV